MLFKLEATFVADGLCFRLSSDLCEVVDVLTARDKSFTILYILRIERWWFYWIKINFNQLFLSVLMLVLALTTRLLWIFLALNSYRFLLLIISQGLIFSLAMFLIVSNRIILSTLFLIWNLHPFTASIYVAYLLLLMNWLSFKEKEHSHLLLENL